MNITPELMDAMGFTPVVGKSHQWLTSLHKGTLVLRSSGNLELEDVFGSSHYASNLKSLVQRIKEESFGLGKNEGLRDVRKALGL